MRLRRRRPPEESIDESESGRKIELKRPEKKRWGRKERYFIFLMVGGTSILSLILAFVSRQGKLPNLPRLTSETIGLSDTVILTKNQIPVSIQARDNEIIKNFSESISALSGVYAFSVVDINSGDTYGLNELDQMEAASIIKLPVMTMLLRDVDQGKLNLDATYVLKNSDKVGGAGSLQSSAEGTVVTYRTLLEYMGKHSDNTAFNIVRKHFGDSAIDEFAKSIGMLHTSVEENMTTPSDMSLLLSKIYQGSLLSTSSKELFFDVMTNTDYEQHLRAGVPEDIVVSHKYGREVHVVNDAGVVFTEKPYVVVIMTGGVVEKEADSIFPRLSEIIYQGQTQ